MFAFCRSACFLIVLSVLLLFSAVPCFADPGGIGFGLEVWLRGDWDDTFTTNTVVWTWDNEAGTNEATQTASDRRPVFRDDALNGYPVLVFDGSNDFFDIDISDLKNTSYTLFGVGIRRDSAGNHFLGTSGGNDGQELVFGYGSDTSAILTQHGANNLLLSVNAHDTPIETPVLLSGLLDTTTGRTLTEYRDGVSRERTDTNTASVTGTKGGFIGREGSDYANMDIAEVVAYSRALSAAEQRQVYSYLALKYGISLGNTMDYTGSNGTVIFDADGEYSGHTHDVAGIGRDDDSELRIESSSSQGTGSVLTVSSPSSLHDNEFLIWGNNAAALSIQETDLPILTSSRLSRVWRFHETGDVGTVTLSFDLSGIDMPNSNYARDYILLVSHSDEVFASSSRYDASSLSGDVLSFNTVSLSSGNYVTLGVKKGRSVSLGGVFSNLRLWLDADDTLVVHSDAACTNDVSTDGTDISCWEDKSTHEAHATVISGDCIERLSGEQTCGTPTYRTNRFNDTRAALEFDRDEYDALRYDLNANGEQWRGDDFTMFTAFEQVNTPETWFSFFSNGTPPGPDHFQIDSINSGGDRQFRIHGLSPDGDQLLFGPFDNILKLYTIRATPSLVELFSDGHLQDSSSVSADPPAGRVFEHYRINQNRYGVQLNNSRIAEVIVYDDSLSNCDTALVNQYLGRKYGRDFGGGIPGGVDCDKVYFWYDGGEEVTESGGSVSQWNDLGPFDVSVTQATSSAQPTEVTPGINQNTVLSFDGNDALSFSGTNPLVDDLERAYYLAILPTSGADSDSVFSHGSSGNGRKVSLGASPTEISVDVGGHVYGLTRSSTSAIEILAFELEEGDSSNEWQIRVNGSDQTERTLSGSVRTLDTGEDALSIGSEAFTTNAFEGDIGEIFVYGEVLSDSDRNKVETYFALKYGVTLASSNDYIDSEGRVLYDSNGTKSSYVSNIAGFGEDDAQSLHTTESMSQTADALLSVALVSEDTLENEEFLVWGSNGGARTETVFNLDSIGNRLTRIWSFSEAGEVGDVDLSFDLSGITVTGTQASDFMLLQSSDASFKSGTTLTSADSFSGNVVVFEDIDVDDGDFIGLGTSMFVGSLTLSVTDASDDEVSNPSFSFGGVNRSDSSVTATGTLGVSTQKITVRNTTSNAAWNLTLAGEGRSSLWSDGTHSFDFNDTLADGSDPDSFGGSLTIDPSTLSISASSGCNTDGLVWGTSTAYSEGSTDSITLLTAGSSADVACSWDITGISLSQEIPAEQASGSYSLGMVLTLTAQ